MLGVLVKKQFAELFRNYFYNQKKNMMRRKVTVAAYFLLFAVIIVGMLGGIFTVLALSFCGVFAQVGLGWLYFLVMGSVGLALGAFGSVFNTYSSLYLAKDNDLLLSLPIPAGTIMAARLVNVYLLGTMYAATVLVPTIIVYWSVAGVSFARVICGILFFLIVTGIVLLLSCLLGLVVAKLSQRIKNKSFIAVLATLLFIGGYYYFYFKANDLIQEIILKADIYGERIKGGAYGLYLFGRIGEGDLFPAVLFTAGTAVLFALVWTLMQRSFLKIATASGQTGKVRYKERAIRQKTVFGALLAKEFGRFTSSANYMLSSGLGILLIPASGVLLLFKGAQICHALNVMPGNRPDSAAVLICSMLCLVSSINNTAVPSVSMEGANLWIPKSLPIRPQQVLHAKVSLQLLLTEIPLLFAVVCAADIVPASPAVKAMLCVTPLIYAAFSTMYGMTIGVRMPLMSWTTEITPLKQSGAVNIFVFTSWGLGVALPGLYLLIGYRVGAVIYLLGCSVLFAAAGVLLLRWLDTKGAEAFAAL